MDLSQLEVFLAVARERRFSRAAEKLFRTQSAVSQAVRKLEIEIGEPLLRAEVDALATLLGAQKPHLHTTSDVLAAARKFNEELSAKIRAGEADSGEFRDRVMKVTRQIVEDKLRIANPRYLEADLKMRGKGSTMR